MSPFLILFLLVEWYGEIYEDWAKIPIVVIKNTRNRTGVMKHLEQQSAELSSKNIGRTVAIWQRSPSDIATDFGITFEKLEDDFEPLLGVLLVDKRTGRRFGLRRYRHFQREGTEILVDEHATDLDEELQWILESLGIDEQEVERVA